LMGDIIQSSTENAIRTVEKKSPNAFRRGEGSCVTGTGLSRGRGEGGGIVLRGIRRRGDGAAREVVRDFTGEEVRLMDDAILSVSTARFDFLGVSDISSSKSVSRSSQSSILGDVYFWVLLGPAIGVRVAGLISGIQDNGYSTEHVMAGNGRVQ
jgi:hypothetical protein